MIPEYEKNGKGVSSVKLSKVKKICLSRGTIICAQAETGMDIHSWIGTNSVMYPVHDLVMTAELACRIWEVESKKLQELFLCTRMKDDDSANSIIINDLEQFPFLGESEGEPAIRKICRIDDVDILYDSVLSKVYAYPSEILGPIEGGKIKYYRLGDWIGIYGDGQIEAAAWCQEPEPTVQRKLKDLVLALEQSGFKTEDIAET